VPVPRYRGNVPAPAPSETLLLRRNSTVLEETLDDEICLYLPSSDEVLVLNRTATDIWRLLDDDSSLWSLSTRIAEIYQMEPCAVVDDVARVVGNFVAQGFADERRGSAS
jgi:hypothetical protein